MEKDEIQKKTNEILEKINNPEEFIGELQILLKTLIDKNATRNYEKIIPNTGKFYGVPKPILWIIATEIKKFIKKKPDSTINLLKLIWSEGSFEARQIVGKSLEKFGPENPENSLDFVNSLLSDLNNWSICDCLAMYGIEPIVISNAGLVLPHTEKWINNKNKWIRRFGVVTLRGYKKIKITKKVFNILDLIMEDKEKDVKKATSWILREITKGNPDEVRIFLTNWAKKSNNKDTKWIIKDGMKKLTNKEQAAISKLL
ncbi:MAG: DNA alkylation repair protein [Candidatus Helarchaeota archaeon]